MDLARKRAQAGGNRVKARLQLREEFNELNGAGAEVGKFIKQVDDFALAEIFLKEGFAFGCEEVDDAFAASSFGDGVDQSGSWFTKVEPGGKSFGERERVGFSDGDRFRIIPPTDPNEFGDIIAAVSWHDTESVADFVSEVRTIERDFDVTSFLGGTGAVQDAVCEKTRGIRVGAGVF